MAGKTNPHFLSLLSTSLVLIVACQVAAKPGGITLELIHRHSPNSPFYQPNLTIDEQIRSLANQTIARSQYLANLRSLATTNATAYHPETVRMLMNDLQQVALYNVRFGLGTLPLAFPRYRSYNFLVDTGSDLTWVQCQVASTSRRIRHFPTPLPLPTGPSPATGTRSARAAATQTTPTAPSRGSTAMAVKSPAFSQPRLSISIVAKAQARESMLTTWYSVA